MKEAFITLGFWLKILYNLCGVLNEKNTAHPNRALERGIEKKHLLSLIEINGESTRKSIREITTVSSSESTSE